MRRATAIGLAGVAAGLAALAGLDARATYGTRTTADEPQYLLTATSLGRDGNLDISDEIASREFAPYHELALNMQTMPLDETGRQVSPHDPLLPALLALPMRLGGWAAAKATLALLAAVTAALACWVATRRLAVTPAAALVGVGAAFVGLPLAAYGTQVYPELPAGLAVLAAVGLLLAPTPRWRHQLGALAAIVALPWLAVKYVPVAAVLGLWLVVTARGAPRRAGALLALSACAAVSYLLLHHWWYGSWTVYATGDHFAETGQFSVVGTRVNLLGRARRLAGLLVDRDFGIAAWAPVWLLGPLGLVRTVGRVGRAGWWLAAVVLAGWLNATFVALTMHGWWVPGRQIVVVLPVAALGLTVLADRSRVGTGVVAGLGALGAVNWLWLAWESSTDRRTLVVDLMSTAAGPYRALRPLLPAGLPATPASPALLVAWALALAGTTLVLARRP